MRQVPAFPQIPESWAEVTETFGDINHFILPDGTLSPKWESVFVSRVALPSPVKYAYGPQMIQWVTIHKLLVPTFTALVAAIWAARLQDTLGAYGGGFVYRANKNNGAVLSLHSYALAQDWNPEGFPNGSAKRRDQRLVDLMEQYGFMCGQEFHHTKDPMHFQFARNI